VYDVVALSEAEYGAVGALVAARHAGAREHFPTLPAVYEDPARVADLIRNAVSGCDRVAAVDERGEHVGFLTSFESAPDPASSIARWGVPVSLR
jgi:hypothetical protein